MNKSLIFSTLLLSSTQLVGYTYAQFTATDDVEAQMNTCEIFPNQLNALLHELVQRLKVIDQLNSELATHSIKEAPTYHEDPFSVEGLSSTELNEIANQLSKSIESLRDSIQVNQNEGSQIEDPLAKFIFRSTSDHCSTQQNKQFNEKQRAELSGTKTSR